MGENQAEIIISVIEEFKLNKYVGYFVTDNALNNDTAIDIVITYFFPNMPEKRRKARRLRYLGHVINLAVKAFLFGTEYDAFEQDIESTREKSELLKELNLWRKRSPIRRLYNIITYICRSLQRHEIFRTIKSIIADEGDFYTEFDYLSLKVNNATRWNSLYFMIERAIKLKDRIDLFCLN